MSTKANHFHTFKVKCIENLLLTVSTLNIRKPDIYKDNTCKRCLENQKQMSILFTKKSTGSTIKDN